SPLSDSYAPTRVATVTNEQQKAVDLATEIGKLGGFVVSVTPPSMSDLSIRFQVLVKDDERIIGELKGWGWSPQRIVSGPRFSVLGTIDPCNSYLVRIPLERTVVPPDKPFGEISKPKDLKAEAELKKMLQSMGKE